MQSNELFIVQCHSLSARFVAFCSLIFSVRRCVSFYRLFHRSFGLSVSLFRCRSSFLILCLNIRNVSWCIMRAMSFSVPLVFRSQQHIEFSTTSACYVCTASNLDCHPACESHAAHRISKYSITIIFVRRCFSVAILSFVVCFVALLFHFERYDLLNAWTREFDSFVASNGGELQPADCDFLKSTINFSARFLFSFCFPLFSAFAANGLVIFNCLDVHLDIFIDKLFAIRHLHLHLGSHHMESLLNHW